MLGGLIALAFLSYYFDFFKDGMVTSGIIVLVLVLYIALMFAETVHDERDEYIRSKVDRILYILTLLLILGDIIWKTFSHFSYMSEVVLLTILSLSKIIVAKVIKNSH